MKQYILYNPLSGNGNAKSEAVKISEASDGAFEESSVIDITSITDYAVFLRGIEKNDRIVICGGDGTLNRFVNSAIIGVVPCDIYYMATGSGNDFLRDIGDINSAKPVSIKKYLQKLPTAVVNGKSYSFLDNVGFGIDGYCTEVGDEMKAKNMEDINYASIAIKGLLGKFHPANAKIVVDGVSKQYDNVWLAPTMNGRFYGGGMIPTPGQDRLNKDHTVSVMVFHTRSKLKALCIFPSIFKGEHIKHKKTVDILVGKNISVEFDRETPLQIDGETQKNILKYEVHAYSE